MFETTNQTITKWQFSNSPSPNQKILRLLTWKPNERWVSKGPRGFPRTWNAQTPKWLAMQRPAPSDPWESLSPGLLKNGVEMMALGGWAPHLGPNYPVVRTVGPMFVFRHGVSSAIWKGSHVAPGLGTSLRTMIPKHLLLNGMIHQVDRNNQETYYCPARKMNEMNQCRPWNEQPFLKGNVSLQTFFGGMCQFWVW